MNLLTILGIVVFVVGIILAIAHVFINKGIRTKEKNGELDKRAKHPGSTVLTVLTFVFAIAGIALIFFGTN